MKYTLIDPWGGVRQVTAELMLNGFEIMKDDEGKFYGYIMQEKVYHRLVFIGFMCGLVAGVCSMAVVWLLGRI